MGIRAGTWPPRPESPPFFRFPALQLPGRLLSYLAERNIGVFSTDIDSRHSSCTSRKLTNSVINQLENMARASS